jgi:hypothetical protein
LENFLQHSMETADEQTARIKIQEASEAIRVNFTLPGVYAYAPLEAVSMNADKILEIRFRTPNASYVGEVAFTMGGGSLGSAVEQTWKYVSATINGVESVNVRSSSRVGGTLVLLSLYGFPALRSRAQVQAEGKRYEDEIVVAFGSLKAEVVRVLASEPPPGRTVIEYRVPATTLAGDALVLIYRSTDPVSSAASYTHEYTEPQTELDIQQGSSRGGLIVTVKSYSFNVEKEGALKVMFGETPAAAVRDSLSVEEGMTTFKVMVPPYHSASPVIVSIQSQGLFLSLSLSLARSLARALSLSLTHTRGRSVWAELAGR